MAVNLCEGTAITINAELVPSQVGEVFVTIDSAPTQSKVEDNGIEPMTSCMPCRWRISGEPAETTCF
jgi:hypothetical protein